LFSLNLPQQLLGKYKVIRAEIVARGEQKGKSPAAGGSLALPSALAAVPSLVELENQCRFLEHQSVDLKAENQRLKEQLSAAQARVEVSAARRPAYR
jgi:hypothetical protein